MDHYSLICMECGKSYHDDGTRLDCLKPHRPAFLQTCYTASGFKPLEDAPGIFRFLPYLPCTHVLEGSALPVVYQSTELARFLGLDSLYITLSGYWPEKGAFIESVSFKELEAFSVLSRLCCGAGQKLVVASAGNTARAFAHVCNRNNMEVILVVPEFAEKEIWTVEPPSKGVRLISIKDGDYLDAIKLANSLACFDGLIAEGGAKNVARRDGMGLSVMVAAEKLGFLPQHYFQAIGSGTGAIAAWEAQRRLKKLGFIDKQYSMKLHLSQNRPFVPVVDCWMGGNSLFTPPAEEEARRDLSKIFAKVLSNRQPPYNITGGLHDILSTSNGEMYGISNDEALQAQKLFEELEGIDILPAAAVAVASLQKAISTKKIKQDDKILLNITGAGEKRLKQEKATHRVQPFLTIDRQTKPEKVFKALSAHK